MFHLPENNTDYYGLLHIKKNTRVLCIGNTSYSSDFVCEKSLDFDFSTYFCSKRYTPFPSITYSFPRHDILITNYTLSTYYMYYPPKAWILEGLMNKDWAILDNVTDSGLTSNNVTITRPVQRIGIYSSIKITMIGTSYEENEKYEFRVAEFDVFGSLHRKYMTYCSCNKRNMYFSIIMYVLVLI